MRESTQIREILDDYIQLHTDEIFCLKPTWYDTLAFLAGYLGEITVDMVVVVRQYQREGKIE